MQAPETLPGAHDDSSAPRTGWQTVSASINGADTPISIPHGHVLIPSARMNALLKKEEAADRLTQKETAWLAAIDAAETVIASQKEEIASLRATLSMNAITLGRMEAYIARARDQRRELRAEIRQLHARMIAPARWIFNALKRRAISAEANERQAKLDALLKEMNILTTGASLCAAKTEPTAS